MKNQPDERLVYLALKNVFRDTDAQLRRPKKIRELILKRQESIDVRDLIEAHNIDNVCNVAKALLEQQIFESTLKAKIRFPEVFEVSPAQSAERSASEQEAARTEADAIQVVAETSRAAGKAATQATPLNPSSAPSGKRKFQNIASGNPSLYPVYLPYQTQHKLLVSVQQSLERACYAFATRTLPDVVGDKEWDCAESVELNLWTQIFMRNQDKFPQEDVDRVGKPLHQLFDSVAQLRHTAVHRLRITANRVELFLVDAESLARLLNDDHCYQELSRLRRETHMSIEDIKRNKDLLETQLTLKLKKIAAQRAEIDRLEKSVVADMLREDQEYRQFAGTALNQAIDAPDTVLPSTAATELDVESDLDVTGFQVHDTDAKSGRDDWTD
ncbi:hypothetical protein PMZ80_011243 [Knufia obscura]|uniref:Uncharacterized protein n=3 Tax=Trichomeriaceae TaxID=1233474 RepID=A0ABR0JWC0_9EURO|nr:hypothetical protein LTR24_010231 [Lithohypha guttulata]KAK5078750.1 hypothetical protein LTR51_000941 [Lithohypha guttulata]KAK5080323.1 hypothetical protein LTR05_008683 [Lithohypha guttulata]KAK5313850.1 hypothetical protein LTR70_007424 [Exophiala xenobiotica]KAK5936516.1 hypothetical protein PMZ80_011243 [Knufia obscura]